jgi:hypothetical protein
MIKWLENFHKTSYEPKVKIEYVNNKFNEMDLQKETNVLSLINLLIINRTNKIKLTLIIVLRF